METLQIRVWKSLFDSKDAIRLDMRPCGSGVWRVKYPGDWEHFLVDLEKMITSARQHSPTANLLLEKPEDDPIRGCFLTEQEQAAIRAVFEKSFST